MKIAHVLDSLEVGGAERVVLTLCELQLKEGHAVEVHYLYRSGPLESEFKKLGIPLYSSAASTGLKITRRLTQNLKTTRPGVLHMHNATATIFGTVAAILAGVPVRVSTRHGLTPREGMWKQETKFWCAARFCQYIVPVSSQAERNIREHPFSVTSKVHLVVNGATPAARSTEEPVVLGQGFTFIHVARLHAIKDQTTLLQAFAQAVQQQPALRLVLIGDGALRTQLEDEAQHLGVAEQVLFAGERQYVGNWLDAADCFVLSSRSEATPVSLLEALAAGLPVIVTSVGEMPIIVNQANCGEVVPPASPAELAQAMLRIAALPEVERHELGQNARTAYLARFQPEAMTQHYEQLYKKALQS